MSWGGITTIQLQDRGGACLPDQVRLPDRYAGYTPIISWKGKLYSFLYVALKSFVYREVEVVEAESMEVRK